MKLSLRFLFLLVLFSLFLSACGDSGIDAEPLINISTVTPKYGDGGYKLQILPIDFSEIPYDLSDSYVAYYAVYEIGPGQLTFAKISVGSNFEEQPNVHYFKVIPIQVETGPVTAFDQNAYDAMLNLCLAISK